MVALLGVACGDDAPRHAARDGGGVLGGGAPGRPGVGGDAGQSVPAFDAGSSVVAEAGSSSVPDAGFASAPSDAGASSAQGDAAASEEMFYARLRTCGLLSAGRVATAGAPSSPLDACVRPCLLAATCQELALYLCGGELSGSFETCATACVPKCEGGTATGDVPDYCDGERQCKDGSDEADCERFYFVCKDGTKTSRDYLCDGSDDCADGSDELGCAAAVSCGPGQDTIPALFVCDQEPDCASGADEVGCAEYVCG
jgi:hypothetical protein